jgi:hypothetical protein
METNTTVDLAHCLVRSAGNRQVLLYGLGKSGVDDAKGKLLRLLSFRDVGVDEVLQSR